MKKALLLVVTSFIIVVINSAGLQAQSKVAWFKSGTDTGFWPVLERIMIAAANDIGVELSIHEFNNDPNIMLAMVEKAMIDTNSRPDCILFHNYKKRGELVLQLAEKYNVRAFVFNAGFPKKSNVGAPRERYSQWIGQLIPEDENAGFLLAENLIKDAGKLDKVIKSGKIQMVALEGNRTSEASNKRVRGLNRSLAMHPHVINKQFFHSKWKESLAQEAFDKAIMRYPDVSVFWTASDNMAVGVIKAAEKKGWIPGKDFVVGGIDVLPVYQPYIKSGQMAASIGGHYFDGAWSLVMIYDFLHGFDFAGKGQVTFKTKMFLQTASGDYEVGDLRTVLTDKNLKKLNFRLFSKTHNPKVKTYDFDIMELLTKK